MQDGPAEGARALAAAAAAAVVRRLQDIRSQLQLPLTSPVYFPACPAMCLLSSLLAFLTVCGLSALSSLLLRLPQELGLPEDAKIPMMGFIGRLDYQKGVDLIRDNYDWLMSGGCGCACACNGTGCDGISSCAPGWQPAKFCRKAACPPPTCLPAGPSAHIPALPATCRGCPVGAAG